MKPISQVSELVSSLSLVGVLSDIDDTLTLDGKLTPEAFAQLAALRARGLKVVLVTGRPAGWVDHIARMWPVDAVVGENGGMWAYLQSGRLVKRYITSAPERAERRKRLRALEAEILRRVPGAALASDQAYRELDLAIDFCEDVPPLTREEVQEIVRCFEAAGAQAKVSSIHVNGWFGTWDKLSGVRRLMRDLWDIDLACDGEMERWVYFGDSANDEPMFAAFPYSVGVANVRPFLDQMSAHPRWITEAEGGYGFVEGTQLIWP